MVTVTESFYRQFWHLGAGAVPVAGLSRGTFKIIDLQNKRL